MSFRCCSAARAWAALCALTLWLVARSFCRRPTRSPIRSQVERIGAPLGPIPPGNPSPRPCPTTRPHRQQVDEWVRVVGPDRGTEPGEGPSGARSVAAGMGERQVESGRWWWWLDVLGSRDQRRLLTEGEEVQGRTCASGAPEWACGTADDCSQRRRSQSASDTPSATSGDSVARASCRGSNCPAGSTCGSPRRTSSAWSTSRVAARLVQPDTCRRVRSPRRYRGSEVA